VQDRKADTYVQMLEMFDWIMQIVNATQPIVEPGPPHFRSPTARLSVRCRRGSLRMRARR
jgi:hypothetical protein